MKKPVVTTKAPAAVGPYSQGIVCGDLVFSSGQLPMNPETKTMPEDIAEQARYSLQNVQAVLEAAGSGMDQVVKTTVFLTNMADFAKVNEVYSTFFKDPFPARSCIAVAALPLGARLEIEAIATVKK